MYIHNNRGLKLNFTKHSVVFRPATTFALIGGDRVVITPMTPGQFDDDNE